MSYLAHKEICKTVTSTSFGQILVIISTLCAPNWTLKRAVVAQSQLAAKPNAGAHTTALRWKGESGEKGKANWVEIR